MSPAPSPNASRTSQNSSLMSLIRNFLVCWLSKSSGPAFWGTSNAG